MAALQLGSQPRYDALWNGLSVVGEKGTLVDQLLGLNPPVEGKLSGKTGFLSGVSSLVGKIDDDARHFQFAFVDNGDYSQTVAEALRRDAVEVLNTFPDGAAGRSARARTRVSKPDGSGILASRSLSDHNPDPTEEP